MKTLRQSNSLASLLLTLLTCLAVVSAHAQTQHDEIKHPPGDFVTVNGARLWYEIEGHGKPLLLIAGGPGASHSYFHPYFSALADSFSVIYFDAFGRGKSERAKSPKEYTFTRDVDDLEGLRRALGLEKINLIGHSYGGMVAQAYALKYPSSIKKLILANTLFSAEMWQANNDNCNNEIRNQFPEVWEKLQRLRSQGLHSSAQEHENACGEVPLGLFYFYNASRAGKEPLDVNPDVYYTIAGDDADFLIGGDMASVDFRVELKRLSVPTLILAGRFDRVALPRFSVQFKRYAPQAEFVMFEESGHHPYIEEPDRTFNAIRKFLRK
jgi:proline iminopeptidase